jgi:putative aldouronate transport system permease protein
MTILEESRMHDFAKKQASSRNLISHKANVSLNLVFLAYSVLCLLPLVLIFVISITDEKAIASNGYSLFPEKLSTLAYRYIFTDAAQIIRSYGISIFVTVTGCLLSILIISLYAYPISRKDFKYRNFFSFFAFFCMLFNGGLVPWYLVYTRLLQLKDNILVLIIPLLIPPFYVIIMKTFFANSIPASVVESAKMDGAGELRIFFSIVLRLSTPALATIGLFSMLGYWNDWFVSLMFIIKERLMPLQLLLYRVEMTIQTILDLSTQLNMGEATLSELPGESARMALCIVTIGPIVLAYPFFQRFFIKGLTIGAVKG